MFSVCVCVLSVCEYSLCVCGCVFVGGYVFVYV